MWSIDGLWIVLTGALVTGACALVGCFLILRRLSMVGDAISHAILPGIVIAYLMTGSRSSLPMFAGAMIVGALTTFLIQYLSENGVRGDAAMGVTFTAMFAIGVVLVSVYGRQVDLDLDCVLYGEIAYASLDTLWVGDVDLGPRPFWTSGGLFLLNLFMVILFYKEFKICAFDPSMATAVGINVSVMHYLLMGLVSVTTVGAFESVGVILVVAMLIVPAATAYLLTDRLAWMLALSVLAGAISSLAGYAFASWLDCSIAGAMAVVCGILFTLALLFSPQHGIVSKKISQRRLRQRIDDEDVLLWAIRRHETDLSPAFSASELESGHPRPLLGGSAILQRLLHRQILSREGDAYRLTESGTVEALQLLRRHRLYETYLDGIGYATADVHEPVDRVEHYIHPKIAGALEAATDHPTTDPHGKPIPE